MTTSTAPVRHLLLRVADRGVLGSFAVVAVLLAAVTLGAPAVLLGGTLAWMTLAGIIGAPAAALLLLLAAAAALALLLWRWSR